MAVLIVSQLIVPIVEAYACTCSHEIPPRELFDQVTLVFSGVVESVRTYDYDRELGLVSGQTEWVFRVGQVWKGPLSGTYKVLCEENPSECGCGFKVGGHYMVYAYSVKWESEVYRSGLCLRPAPIERTVWDRAVLPDPAVMDFRLSLPRPTVKELADLAEREDQIGRQARRALREIESSGKEFWR